MKRLLVLSLLLSACRSDFDPNCEPGSQGCMCTIDDLCLEGLSCSDQGVCEVDVPTNPADTGAGSSGGSETSSGTGEETTGTTGDGDGDGDGDGGTTGEPPPEPFAPCGSPDDCEPDVSGLDRCVGVSQSFGIVDVPSQLAPSEGFCTHACTSSSECPSDPGASALPRCLEGVCMLDCSATLSTCPGSQSCHPQIDVQGTTTDYDLCGF